MIYLDNAATTLHKPPQVGPAILAAMETMGNSARGSHGGSLGAAPREPSSGAAGTAIPKSTTRGRQDLRGRGRGSERKVVSVRVSVSMGVFVCLCFCTCVYESGGVWVGCIRGYMPGVPQNQALQVAS